MISLAFYKASNGSVIDRLINRFSGNAGYSHVEIVFSNGMFFTSSPRDGGVRLKVIKPDPNHWDFINLHLTTEQEQTIWDWALKQAEPNWPNGKPSIKYDWNGVIGFLLPLSDNPNDKFCSEECLEALQLIDWGPAVRPITVSPNSLYFIARTYVYFIARTYVCR